MRREQQEEAVNNLELRLWLVAVLLSAGLAVAVVYPNRDEVVMTPTEQYRRSVSIMHNTLLWVVPEILR